MRHLDTNIVIAYLRGNAGIADKLMAHLPDIAISSLVLAELYYGARVSTRANENLERLKRLVEIVSVTDFNQSCAEAYGKIRSMLRQKGRPTSEIDALIAAVAIANDVVLVTHNTKHYENIEGLVLEDWLG